MGDIAWEGGPLSPLPMKAPDMALKIPLGLLAWSAIKVDWSLRCALRKFPFPCFFSLFLQKRVKHLTVWQKIQVWVLTP